MVSSSSPCSQISWMAQHLLSKTHAAASLLLAPWREAISFQANCQDLALKGWRNHGIPEGQLASLSSNPSLPAPSRAAQKKAPTIQKSLVGLTSSAFSAWILLPCPKVVAALGMDGWGGMWKQLLCRYSCCGAAPKIPAQINTPVTPSFVKQAFEHLLWGLKLDCFWSWNTPMEKSCVIL